MSELWGFQAGQSMRRQEDSALALNDMALRKGEAELAQADVTLEASNLALDSQRRMIELMRNKSAQLQDRQTQAPPGGGAMESDEIPKQLDELASMAVAAGLPQQAADYASKASTIRGNASEIRKRELDNKLSKLNLASNLLSAVGDETGWRRANALFTMQTGEASPFAEMEYSPELVAQIQDAVVGQKDRALIEAAEMRAAASESQVASNEALTKLRNAQERLADARTTNLKKTGAIGKEPKAEDLRAVSDLINSEFLGAVTPEDARILGRPVAERMMQLQAELNIPRSEAAQRAFNEAENRGDFGGLRNRVRMKGGRENPLEMPSSQDALRPNMFYIGKGKYEGQTLLWTGTGFKLAGSAKVAPAKGSTGAAKKGLRKGETEPFDNEHTDEDESEY